MRIRKKSEDIDNSKITNISLVSDALAHPARINMYCFILKRNRERIPVRNRDIVDEVSYSQATVSQHLNKLLIGNLITAKQEGTSTYYFANIGKISAYINDLKFLDE